MPIVCIPPTSILLLSFICGGPVVSEIREFIQLEDDDDEELKN